MPVNIDEIRDSDIAGAIQIDDLDDAVRTLQDIAGITYGGVAAAVFSNIDFD
jgi:hypothetical protein